MVGGKMDKMNILIIEDNPGDVRLVKEMLAEVKGVSYSLESADNLAKGMERLRREGIDVLLLDLNLPDSTGLTTFSRLHTEFEALPVVIFSGFSEDENVAVKAVIEGAQDYLVKGQVDSKVLSRVIRYAIERKKTELELKEKMKDLEKFNEMAVDRELKMMEMKAQIDELQQKLKEKK
jgi:DNA-binding NtrC family response regulator